MITRNVICMNKRITLSVILCSVVFLSSCAAQTAIIDSDIGTVDTPQKTYNHVQNDSSNHIDSAASLINSESLQTVSSSNTTSSSKQSRLEKNAESSSAAESDITSNPASIINDSSSVAASQEYTVSSDPYVNSEEPQAEPNTSEEQITQSANESQNEQSAAVPQDESVECLYCLEQDRYIYRNNADKQTAPASLTKLLTASVALKYMPSDSVVDIGTELQLVNPGSSLSYIGIGQKIKMYDLISGMLMCSGNDAAYSTAAAVSRYVNDDREMSDSEAISSFCGLMNEFAESIGMIHSNFTTPDGWDSDDQYTTADDLLILAKYALSVPEITEIVRNHQKYVVFESGESIYWTNTNYMLDTNSIYYCENTVGLKTGTTEKAGYCLIGAFADENNTYISIVLGCGSDEERYTKTLNLWNERNNY